MEKIFSVSSVPSVAVLEEMEPLGLGLIGYGGFGRFCLDVYAAMPDLRVVAVADVDAARRQEAAERYGAIPFADAADLLAAPDVDVVAICTPPHTHAPLSLAAARAGKHIFCEKPLALSLEEADAAIAAAERHRVRLTVDYVLRHNPLNRRLHALLRSGVLGPLLHMSLENQATDEHLKPDHWFWDPARSGGIWVEHGVHFFDLFGWLSGQRAQAVAALARTRPDGCRDRVWAIVRYSGGLVATYQHAFTQPARFERTTVRLACARGYATLHGWIPIRLVVDALLDDQGMEALHRWAGVEPEIVERYAGAATEGWALGAPYRATVRAHVELTLPEGKQAVYRASVRAGMEDLIAAIRDPQHRPEVTAADGRNSLAVALAATRAAEMGVWESIDFRSLH
ncbi:MAG TPA: Gfo/Idh/MocA family oxidoreductase [Anaerolineae bacterium]|nr:Gfo/Idh/MocA family oxidoreductase [Anaerolineae bacterium]